MDLVSHSKQEKQGIYIETRKINYTETHNTHIQWQGKARQISKDNRKLLNKYVDVYYKLLNKYVDVYYKYMFV